MIAGVKISDAIEIGQQKQVDARYLNGLVPWTSIAQVVGVNGIPVAKRARGLTVNIAGVEYWWPPIDSNLNKDPIIKEQGGGGIGIYDEEETYDKGDLVLLEKEGLSGIYNLYACRVNGTIGVEPGTDNSKWAIPNEGDFVSVEGDQAIDGFKLFNNGVVIKRNAYLQFDVGASRQLIWYSAISDGTNLLRLNRWLTGTTPDYNDDVMRIDPATGIVTFPNNPSSTLEGVRSANNQIAGDIDADGNFTIINIRNATDPQEPVALSQQVTAIADLEQYTDNEIVALSVELRDGVATEGDTLQKLYNMIQLRARQYNVADIPARDLLLVGIGSYVFVEDDGDGKWALYRATSAGVGASFIKVSDPDLLNAAMTSAQIKASYESNPDTNALTNALLIKLNGISSGATVNQSDAYLLARGNHTGTQLASTISNFESAVLASLLAGLITTSNIAVTAGDNIVVAMGKLQAQINNINTTKANLSQVLQIPTITSDIYGGNTTKLLSQTGNTTKKIDQNSLKRLFLLNYFSPLQISGFIGWYDFSDPLSVTLSSSAISAIIDKSGAGNDLIQATSGNRPTYTAFGGSNDYAYASFTSGKFLAKATAVYTQPFTVIMVVKSGSTVADGRFIEFENNTTNGISQKVVSGSPRTHVTLVSNLNWIGFPTDYGAFAVHGFVFSGTNSLESFNSEVRTLGGSSPGTASTAKLQIGSSSSPNFDCHEVLMWNRALTITEIQNVSDFLISKYAVIQRETVLSIGDSISEGFNSTDRLNLCFTGLVANNYSAQTLNLGVSGATLLTARGQYKKYINSIPVSSYILIQLGTNDGGLIGGSATTWRNTYLDLVNFIISYGFNPARICIITPPYTSTRTTALASIQSSLLYIQGQTGCRYADCVSSTLAAGGDTLIDDGTHPTNAGHLVMANTIIAALL